MKLFWSLSNPWVIAAAALCVVFLAVFATALVLASVARVRAAKRFGELPLVEKLETHDAAARRAVKGVLLVFGMVCAVVALARPMWRGGTRLVPATTLDVVVVLDYSKSMYARDITPSRIARAKAEVADLVKRLPGSRFGAVAFAGEPMSFPLTTDGAAIAQFFRNLEPNDMPVGGTATARALERARELFARDPKSKDHARVIVLITDGEDLEGEPVQVAQAAAQEGTRIDVVQIGGRAPEPIPEVGEGGKVLGLRRDEDGKPLTTELSPDGEAQLARIAQVTGGKVVRSEKDDTKIEEITRGLSTMQRTVLAEKNEDVFGEQYHWPLGVAFLLLCAEAFIPEAPRRRRPPARPPPPRRRRGALKAAVAASSTLLPLVVLGACGWDPSRPFERESPQVNQAIRELDAGDATASARTLEEYLSTGACADGKIGTPDLVRRADGTFDLGLSLFHIGESFGRRFGEEEKGGAEADEAARGRRRAEVDCALQVVRAVHDVPKAGEEGPSVELRARARYLEGNLLFLVADYEAAVRAYDQALTLAPGMVDAGDPVGRDAAWNRAIALRRIEDKKKDGGSDGGDGGDDGGDGGDGGKDGGDDGGKDGGDDGGKDGGDDGGKDGGDDGGKDAGKDGGDAGRDAGKDGGDDPSGDAGQDGGDAGPPPPPHDSDGGAPPPPKASQDERMLDQLENTPTFQQEAERRRMKTRKVRGMVDK